MDLLQGKTLDLTMVVRPGNDNACGLFSSSRRRFGETRSIGVVFGGVLFVLLLGGFCTIILAVCILNVKRHFVVAEAGCN